MPATNRLFLFAWIALLFSTSATFADDTKSDKLAPNPAYPAKPDTFTQPKTLAELLALPPVNLRKWTSRG